MSSSLFLRLCKPNAAVFLTFLSFLAYCTRPSVLQSGDSVDLMMNDSAPCPANGFCEKLPGHCLDCNFDESCVYGGMSDVNCTPYEGVECMVSESISCSVKRKLFRLHMTRPHKLN